MKKKVVQEIFKVGQKRQARIGKLQRQEAKKAHREALRKLELYLDKTD